MGILSAEKVNVILQADLPAEERLQALQDMVTNAMGTAGPTPPGGVLAAAAERAAAERKQNE